MVPKIDPSPDWKKWKHMKRAYLSDAVGLALNINPELLKVHSKFGAVWMDKGAQEEARVLWAIANNRISEIHQISGNRFGGNEVDLVAFGRFVESLGGYEMPIEFPREKLGSTDSEALPRDVPVVNLRCQEDAPPYLTSKLRLLFKIMREVKKRPGTKPINVIMDMTGLDDRNARILASLINDEPNGTAKKWKDEEGA